MRGMKGQWEQEIDWQGTLRDKVRQQQKQSKLLRYGTI